MPFLNLPREVRDAIYHHYVFEADGYHLDYASGKLRRPGDRPIDLALMYTCRAVALDIRHLALSSNVLHFSTIGSDKERSQADRFDLYFREVNEYKSEVLRSLSEPRFHGYMTPELLAKVADSYPQFEPLLQLAHDPPRTKFDGHPLVGDLEIGNGSIWGEPGSTFRAFQDHLIELLSKHTDFSEAYASVCDDYSKHSKQPCRLGGPYNTTGQNRLHVGASGINSWSDRASFVRSKHLLSSLRPWSIPTEQEHTGMSTLKGLSSRRGNFRN